MNKVRLCPVCSITNPIIMTKLGREEYTKCMKCGLLYTHKPVSINDFISYYDDGREPGKNYHDDYINDPDSHKRNELLARQMQLLSEEEWANKDLLEIGCSSGYFLKTAEELGARIKGVEISQYASKYAEELLKTDVICGNWEVLDIDELYWNHFFDIVTMSHVIEHFVHPVEAIIKIGAVLRIGGALISQHPDASVYPGVKFHVRDHTPKEHLQIFDAETIIKPMMLAGFKRVQYVQEEPGQSISVFRKIKEIK